MKPFLPEHNLEPSSVAGEFDSLVEQVATQLRSADSLALDQIQIHSPFRKSNEIQPVLSAGDYSRLQPPPPVAG